MIEFIREFRVREPDRGRFELAYGPGGAWSDLLAAQPGFRGLTVLRDAQAPERYLTVEAWDSPAQREKALAACAEQHSRVEAAMAPWVLSVATVGVFRFVTEAAVRPRPGVRVTRGRRAASGS